MTASQELNCDKGDMRIQSIDERRRVSSNVSPNVDDSQVSGGEVVNAVDVWALAGTLGSDPGWYGFRIGDLSVSVRPRT